MSPETSGAGGKKNLSETEGSEVISDVDHNDELDNDIKLEEENDDEEPITIPIKNSEIEGVQICEVCSKSLQSMKNLEKHMRTHSNPSFCCSDCGKIFESIEMSGLILKKIEKERIILIKSEWN